MLRMPPQGFDARLFYGLGTIIRRIYYPQNFVWRDQAYLAFGDGVHVEPVPGLEGQSWAPALEVAVYDDTVLLVVGGTNQLAQWISHVVLSGLITHQEWPGKVHGFFGPAAFAAWELFRPAVIAAIADNPRRKILCIGHSYGGSVAQLMGHLVYREYMPLFEGVVSFSSPRTGDRNWAAAINADIRVIRIRSGRDLFTEVPPQALVYAPGFGPLVQLDYRTYQHAGTGFTLGPNGELVFDAAGDHVFLAGINQVDPTLAPVGNLHGLRETGLRLRLRIPGSDPSSREYPALSLSDNVNHECNQAEGVTWRFTR